MGWRAQDSYDRDNRAHERAFVRALPFRQRLAVRLWNFAAFVAIAGLFALLAATFFWR